MIALFLVMLISLLGAAVWAFSSTDQLQAIRQEKQIKAYYLAQSGADAVASYITNPLTTKTQVNNLIGKQSDPQTISGIDGSFVITITRVSDSTSANYLTITITSTATIGDTTEKVKLDLKPSFSKSIVAVSTAIQELFSNSGLANSWTTTGGIGQTVMNDVSWNGLTYVAVGETGYLKYSEDGVTWSNEFRVSYTIGGNSYINTKRMNAVTWTGSLFVSVGDNAAIITSPTGKLSTWNFIPITKGTAALRDVASNGSKIIAVSDAGIIRTSDNGSSWSDEKLAKVTVTENLKRIYWLGDHFIILGDNQTLLGSASGEDGTWIDYTLSSGTHGLNAIACDSSISSFVGVGNTGMIRTSANGITWSSEFSSGVTANLNDVFWAGDSFIAFGNNGTIISSPTGKSGTWTNIGTSAAYNIKNAAYGGIGAIYNDINIVGKK